MNTTGKYEQLKKKAEEARRKACKTEEVDANGLASIRPTKIISPADEAERKRNKEKHLAIIRWVTEVNAARQQPTADWKTPVDWRMVTEKTVHKYIPFNQKNIQLSEAVRYVTEHLAKHGRPKNKKTEVGEDTPLWYLSRNQIRKALYKASITCAREATN
ncbi:ubiquitin-protein ligase E3B [Aphis craccivora]|uniref:Ubiquitin-protein ligase E3B n=1 Tax=Aphis craccivora TaxID=307492 RepID=A0A6G0W3Q1_APHCR|nr:ubiquitin-protein ligase E3B [Aphis craccivora]